MSTDAQTQAVAGSDSPDAGGHDAATPQAGQDAAPVADPTKMQADLNRANKEAAERRVALKAAQDELAALKTQQAAAEQKALAERGEYQKLYEAETATRADLEKQIAALNDRIRSQELAALRQQVAAEKSLPASLAERLRGETAEELAADADALLAALPRPVAPGLNGGTRGATGGNLTPDDAKRIAGRFNIDPRYLTE